MRIPTATGLAGEEGPAEDTEKEPPTEKGGKPGEFHVTGAKGEASFKNKKVKDTAE